MIKRKLMTTQINATILSVEFNVMDGQYEYFKVNYLTDTKERKSYRGFQNMLKSNRVLNDQLRKAQPNDSVVLIMVPQAKNPKYMQLQSLEIKGQQAAQAIPAKTVSSSGGSTYETKEERAVKQRYIVRQSSISSAIELLTSNGLESTVGDVLNVAKQFEAFVFGEKLSGNTDQPANEYVDLNDDIPFDIPE
jgi:hypothetical protein